MPVGICFVSFEEWESDASQAKHFHELINKIDKLRYTRNITQRNRKVYHWILRQKKHEEKVECARGKKVVQFPWERSFQNTDSYSYGLYNMVKHHKC